MSRPQNPRHAQYEEELHLALVEGVLSREQVEALREEALRLGRGPLELMLERGLLSPDSLLSLRGTGSPAPRPTPGTSLPFEAPSTQRPGTEAPSTPAEPVFPLPQWERYQPVRFLGQGGMGQVFLAYDPRLRRNVALKFVRDGAPELAQRFLSEARAQARVRHERVCEMYEVGEVRGQAYIAMQYVNGRTLGQLARELTLEQRLRVLRDVAEGVHAAHRAGLIHRDLKPSNVLVERSEDGALRAYVMDFGLARDWHAEHTATGAVLGTPHYMAPEQARGEVAHLDRRVDVYSLGATLYQVLTGVPPFAGTHPLELLHRIQSEEPVPPRQRQPELPADVEAIVLKCLEKDRAARYDSARALAEDIERFLSGEPVLARRAGPGYRLRKKLRKHRLLVGLGATALLGLVVGGGHAALTQRQVVRRERLARSFTEHVERLEAQARYSALAPLHDTRPDRRALRQDMASLEAEIREAGPAAEAPGHYALGRTLLALGDAEAALPRLEAAWHGGYREGRVAYALALALGQHYRQRLLEVEWLRDKGQREARRAELERRYRDPALAYLRQSEGSPAPSPHYAAALLAFYAGQHERALAELEAMGTALPWFHEAPLLRGDILRHRAFQRLNRGERAGALADVEAAHRAYAAAAAIGQSDPAAHHAQGALHLTSLLLELYGQGEVEPYYAKGLEALGRALTAAPDHVESKVLGSRLHRRLAEFRLQRGGDAGPLVERALVSANEALALAPGQPRPLLELAQVLRLRARALQERGEDPGEALEQTARTFARVAPPDRDYRFHIERGHAFKVWADAEDAHGQDSLPHRAQAIASYQAALALEPGAADGWTSLGTAYFKRATHANAPDADADLERADQALERARGIDPGNFVTPFYGAQVHEWRARRRHNRGGAVEEELERAIALYRQGLAINAKLPQLHNALGGALLWRADLAWERGELLSESLDAARAAFEQARSVAPPQAFAYNNLGEVDAFLARVRRQRGEDPTASVRAADAAYAQALERMPRQAQFHVNRAKVLHTQALWTLERGGDPEPTLALATQALTQALALNPQLGDALRYQGEVGAVHARALARRGLAHEEDFARAAGFFQRALATDPGWHEDRLAAGLLHHAWAEWRAGTGGDPAPVLSEGLTLLEAALAARPRWAQAHAARARLLLTRVETTKADVEAREAWRNEAREELRRALALNPQLGHAWRSLLGEAALTSP